MKNSAEIIVEVIRALGMFRISEIYDESDCISTEMTADYSNTENYEITGCTYDSENDVLFGMLEYDDETEMFSDAEISGNDGYCAA